MRFKERKKSLSHITGCSANALQYTQIHIYVYVHMRGDHNVAHMSLMQLTQVACKKQYSSSLPAHQTEHRQNFKILCKEKRCITS
jgi:hypothetical protein